MDDATLTALKESIEKWERRAGGEYLPLGATQCPLCKLFHLDYTRNGKHCDGCPVFARTGQRSCGGTPYHAYNADRTTPNAQRELDFLKSLLPAKEAEKPQAGFGWVDLNYLS